MRRILAPLLFLASCALAPAQIKPEILAQGAADSWLPLVDQGRFGESWDQAAASFQTAVTRQSWTEKVGGVRANLGDLKSRNLRSANYTKQLPGAPPGEYVLLQYDTSFANLPAAIETVVPMKEKDGSWKVSGYFVKPKQ